MKKTDLKTTIGLIAGAGAALALMPVAQDADNPFDLPQANGAVIVVADGRINRDEYVAWAGA